MADRLRIALLDPSPYSPVRGGKAPSSESHRRLTTLIRLHLPGVTASLFAEPRPSPDGRAVEWYSDLRGQPTLLSALPPREQERVRRLVANRLRSLADLGDRLDGDGKDPKSTEVATELRNALSFPGEESLYVIGGQPVITFWGYAPTGDKALVWVKSSVASSASTAEPVENGAGSTLATVAGPTDAPRNTAGTVTAIRRRPIWRWLFLVLLLVLLLVFAFYALHRFLGWGLRWPPWGPDYPKLLDEAAAKSRDLESTVGELEENLRRRLEICRTHEALAVARTEAALAHTAIEGLAAQVRERLALCPVRAELDAARAEGLALTEVEQALDRDLKAKLKECRQLEEVRQHRREEQSQREERATSEASAKTKAATSAPSGESGEKAAKRRPDGLPPCPGERAPEEAPDIAVVLDASGSMAFPASVAASELMKAMGQAGGLPGLLGSIFVSAAGGPSRLDEAKKGLTNVVRSLPDDVDVGMTVLRDCPRADNLGFFSSSQRDQLYSKVRALRPARGTPLSEGLLDAGGMVNGVAVPGVIVVISDGEDSCGANPCATARMLKAQKPNLTINVVDLMGDGAGACLAEVTGGKVLRPEDGLAFERTIRKAVEEVAKPAHCP